ncbi:14-3-3 protein [Lepidopterella palustris CBS 459.81]|uniref:14-3-3 protein n=1 Tax=Lepidopterella palustris CBS 459.81 TaxID=1314670 RepID=A0A8E2JF51_9PEZI|nr:14-3-3 protein [Lepidopterella palustris CBS 459.81]
MASSDVDQKWLGRIARDTSSANALLSSSLYQILGLSVLLSRKLYRARKLRKLDTSRDTKSLSLYQHILWLSREGLSILELYVLPYAQDNQYGPECRVLSVKLRASFYHIFCLFHNQPPISAINIPTFDARSATVPPVPLSPRQDNGQSRRGGTTASPSIRRGKQPMLREPIESITSETSFLTNPYAAGGPVGTPSPHPPSLSHTPSAPPGLNPVPIPQPSSFLLPPLNFLPLAGAHFTTASAYATAVLPGSHPLRLSVALEHAAFLWDCLHDHEGARRMARRAIKDVYRAPEGMDDAEFEDAAELVSVLGRMMKRKSWEGTPRVPGTGIGSPVGVGPGGVQAGGGGQGNGVPVAPIQQSPRGTGGRRQHEGPTATSPTSQRRGSNGSKSGSNRGSGGSKSGSGSGGSKENTPRTGGAQRRSKETTPRAKHLSTESGGSTTPRALQGMGRSPTTPTSARSVAQPGSGSSKGKSPVSPRGTRPQGELGG